MSWWFRVILLFGCLICCLAVLSSAQASNENVPAQIPAVERGQPGNTASATTNAEYPLDAFTDFSAVMLGSMMSQPSEGDREAHIYRSGDLMRMENVETAGYVITDLKTLDTYGVTRSACLHETHAYFRASPFPAARLAAKIERVGSGKETLDGHSCQIEDITVSWQKGMSPLKMRFWEAEDLKGFPIKIEFLRPGGHDAIILYKNVVLAPQDPSLFIHPKTCQGAVTPDQPAKPKAAKTAKKPTTDSSKK
jgi:hypothetical protein